MLKTIFATSLLFLSLSAMACWKVEGSLAVDGETWKFNQKFDHGKEYALPMGNFILRMTLNTAKNKTQTLKFVVEEKKGTTLTLITKGEEEEIKVGESRDVYAKGAEGQPNSIITVKLTQI